MNSMYLRLTKIFIKENISFKRLMGFDTKKAKVKTILISIAIVYALISFLGVFGYMFFDLGKILSEMGQIQVLISFLAIYATGLTFILVLFRAQGYMFHYKDYDILAPLPISNRTTLYAKMSVMLLIIYLSSFAFTIPIGFSYFYWHGFSILGFIVYIISMVFFPLIPIIIGSFLSLGIQMITSRLKHNKLFTIILLFVIFIGFMMFTFSIGDAEINPLTGQIELYKAFSSYYLPMKWMIEAIHDLNVVSLLLLVFGNGLVFALFIYFVQGLVNKTNQKGSKANVVYNNKKISYQDRPVIWTLTIKEWKKFINIPIYALNAGFGSVILLVSGIASLFYKDQLSNILVEMTGAGLLIEVMILLLVGFCVAMAYTPAISLSLEGKNLWIIKSLPIPPKTLMFSKILFNILLIAPIAVISLILFGYAFQIAIMNQLLMILLIVVFSVMISMYNAIINLYMPKFNFQSEVEVIKQSAGALLGVFGGFFFMIISGFTYYFLIDMIEIHWVLLCLIGINLLFGVLFYEWINHKTEPLFSKF